MIQIGIEPHVLADLYHSFLEVSWLTALSVLAGIFVALNAVFAMLYLACGDCIEGARHHNILDAFFFSVQTMATIGYGQMAPNTLAGNVLVSVEAFLGLLGLAMMTGLVFSKFSRPTARVMFSKVAVISRRDGKPCLLFRIASERMNRIVEAQVHVVLVRNEVTKEGEQLRRFYDLNLERERTALFAISWTVVHPITEKSPLYGATPQSLAESGAGLVVSMTGLEETFSQTVHARHSYASTEIIPNARFVDIFTLPAEGSPRVDYRRFHDWLPLDSALEKNAASGSD